MNHTWKVTVWGVRGSFPTPGAEFAEYGGSTSCICVDTKDRIVIFDGGSGLLKLGSRLRSSGRKRADILVSHLHMDHCLGLFGFPLFQDPHAQIHLYGSSHQGISFGRGLETLLGPPYWPLSLRDSPAHVEIHELIPGEGFRLAGTEGTAGEIKVSTMAGNHPDQSLLYRIDSNDKSVIYALDCELDEDTKRSITAFSQGGSLLIWDACFSEEELPLRRGWGHSSWQEGSCLRQKAGAGMALMTHFSSGYTDSFLREQERLCAEADPCSRFAKEGLEILL